MRFSCWEQAPFHGDFVQMFFFCNTACTLIVNFVIFFQIKYLTIIITIIIIVIERNYHDLYPLVVNTACTQKYI